MQQFQHPASEERVVRAGDGLEQRVAQDRNRVRLGLQGLAEGREQLCLLFRVRGHAERGGECLQWVHRRQWAGLWGGGGGESRAVALERVGGLLRLKLKTRRQAGGGGSVLL